MDPEPAKFTHPNLIPKRRFRNVWGKHLGTETPEKELKWTIRLDLGALESTAPKPSGQTSKTHSERLVRPSKSSSGMGKLPIPRFCCHRLFLSTFSDVPYPQCGEQNAALKSRAFGPRTAAEARRAEAVVAKRLAQRFVLGVRSGRMY